jgi:protocatechuate 3,4-dioxygenase beta subunit
MRRRDFLRTGAAALAWAGCGSDGSRNGRRVDGSPGPGDDCAATASNIEGPFYTPGAPGRMVLADQSVPGQRLRISGRVLSAADGCTPLAGASLDVWQADADGAYDEAGFQLRGVLETAADGSYEIATIVPGHYLNGASFRPAHIHVKASAPGRALITTQLYFAGDPYNDGDAFIVDSLIMPVEEQDDGSIACTFDFVL